MVNISEQQLEKNHRRLQSLGEMTVTSWRVVTSTCIAKGMPEMALRVLDKDGHVQICVMCLLEGYHLK